MLTLLCSAFFPLLDSLGTLESATDFLNADYTSPEELRTALANNAWYCQTVRAREEKEAMMDHV